MSDNARSHKRGATGLTYSLVVGLVAVAGIGAVSRIGTSVETLFVGVASSIDGTADPEPTIPAPFNSVAPTITGNNQIGQTLTANVGTWDGDPVFEIRWLRNGTTEVGTGETYTVVTADGGQNLSIEVTATENGKSSIAVSDDLAIDTVIFAFSSHTFNNCGSTGPNGPSTSNCRSNYNTDWDESSSNFTVSNGIQQWTVPATGNYRITAAGARGGDGSQRSPGNGYIKRGDFSLTQGETLYIVVGQRGVNGSNGGGGGGSFVYRSRSEPLIIGAGGGGGGYNSANGQTGSSGTSGTGVSQCGTSGGSNGSGGRDGLAGAGWLDNGSSGANSSTFVGAPNCGGGDGGFGGGGCGNGGDNGGGGGGGYSGGGGGCDGGNGYGGGGGGSYNAGSNGSNVGGNSGQGYVTIQRL